MNSSLTRCHVLVFKRSWYNVRINKYPFTTSRSPEDKPWRPKDFLNLKSLLMSEELGRESQTEWMWWKSLIELFGHVIRGQTVHCTGLCRSSEHRVHVSLQDIHHVHLMEALDENWSNVQTILLMIYWRDWCCNAGTMPDVFHSSAPALLGPWYHIFKGRGP